MVTPISPIDIGAAKKAAFPDEVMQTWNDRIALNFSNGYSVVEQKEIVKDLCDRLSVSRFAVFENKWLDVEDIYRAQGWKVEYDKPAYYETYDPCFTFTPAG